MFIQKNVYIKKHQQEIQHIYCVDPGILNNLKLQ